MFLASNCCCVNSGTVKARYCWEPREVWREGRKEGREGGRGGTYQGGEADHEEVEAGEGHHVNGELLWD